MKFGLSVLTEPQPQLPKFGRLIATAIRNRARYYLKGKISKDRKKFGGHDAVTRSLITGLSNINANFNYNPETAEIHENVILLSGIDKLNDVLELKRKGIIKFLLVGPNMVDHVLDFDNIVAHPLIDYFVVPSDWVKRVVLDDSPNLRNRILIWPAGVDCTFWRPKKGNLRRKSILLYIKTEHEDFHDRVLKLLESMGFQVDIVKYGHYNSSHYKKMLNRASFAIIISRSESQGIALTEAWAMDVPTLVFNPGEFFYGGKLVKQISACPYLTRSVGRTWKSINELQTLIQQIKSGNIRFMPRKFATRNFSDELCARHLLTSIEKLHK